jgi:hypothetical protein
VFAVSLALRSATKDTNALADFELSFAAELSSRRTQLGGAELVTEAPTAAPTAAPAGGAGGPCPGGSVVVSGTAHDGVYVHDPSGNNAAQRAAGFAAVWVRRPLPGSKVEAFLTYTDTARLGPVRRAAAAQSPLEAAYSSVSSGASPFSSHRETLAEQTLALTQGCQQGQYWSVSCFELQRMHTEIGATSGLAAAQ